MITTEQLMELKARLKQVSGYRQLLHERTGLSFSYIDSVLNPENKRSNDDIIDAAFEILEEYDKEQEVKKAQRDKILYRK